MASRAAGQPIAFIDPLGFRTSVVFDAIGQPVGVVDALGRRTSAVFDGIGQQTAGVGALGYRTTGIYDSVGQMTALVDANSHRTTASFSGRGDLLSTRDPLSALTSWSYDGEGNVILRVDARNRPTTFGFDSLNRVVSQLYSDGTRVTNTFDAAGQQLTMQDVSGITNYSYDQRGMPVVVVNGAGMPLTATFDPVGNTTQLKNFRGQNLVYGYDAQNRCITVQNPDSELTSQTWDALDRMLKTTQSNGMAASRSYDAAGNAQVLTHRNSAGTLLASYTGFFDAIGNRITTVELDGTRISSTFDPTYQLTNEQRGGTNPYNITLSYDPAGNRIVRSDSNSLTTYTHNAANEMTLLVNPTGQPTTQSFDANGNLTVANTGGSLTTYTWDGEDRMTRVDNSDGTNEQYTYSADGLRQKKVAGAATVLYGRDGDNILLETDASLVIQVRYTDLPGMWGGKFSLHRSGASSFYMPDFQGNTRGLANASQTITDTLVTDAWGREIAKTGTIVDPFKAFGQYGYYRDSASRLYVEARHLDTTNGRWLSRDPIGFWGGSSNLYGYVGNDPVMWFDPTGEDALVIWGRNYRNPEFFHALATMYAKDYIIDAGNRLAEGTDDVRSQLPTAYVVHVESKADVITALRNHDNIDTLIYVGHGGSDKLYLSNKELLTADVASLPKTLMPGASIRLYSCDSGGMSAKGGINIAQAFANRFNTKVRAVNGGLSFGLPVSIMGKQVADLQPGLLRPGLGWVTAQPGGRLGSHVMNRLIPPNPGPRRRP